MKKRRVVVVLTGVAIVVAIIFAIANKGEDVEYITSTVEQGKLIQTVIETGTIRPISEFQLNFASSGKVGEIMIAVGDEVIKDQTLAKIDQTDLLIREQEALANLNVAQANLNKLITGASASARVIAEANEAQAEASYQAAVKDLDSIKQTVNESLAQAEKRLYDLTSIAPGTTTIEETTLTNYQKTYKKDVDNKIDVLLATIENKQAVATASLDAIDRIINDDDIDDFLGVRDSSTLINTNLTYDAGKAMLTIAKSDLSLAKMDDEAINSGYNSTIQTVNKIFESLNYCFSTLENSITASDLTQAELDVFKAGVNTQITNITTAISGLQTAKQSLDNAILTFETKISDAEASLANAILIAGQTLSTTKVANAQTLTTAESRVDTSFKSWQIYKAQLADTKAPARSEDLMLRRAQVTQAQAQLALMNNQIEQNIIKAPIDGVITKIDFEVGEQTSPTQTIVTMLADHSFVLELDISETDISQLHLDDIAIITIDAYGEDIEFAGTVTFIEPAETEIQGVIYYKVDVDFDPGIFEIKSGMTASATITTAIKEDVLMIPVRAVLEHNKTKVVRVMFGKTPQELPVILGLLGDNGIVEVISGVNVGDEVVTYVKNGK